MSDIDQTETLSSLPAMIQTAGDVVIRPLETVPSAPANDAAMVLSLMTSLVMSGDMTGEKVAALEQLAGLQTTMENRQAERAFSRAFVAMQSQLPRIKRDGTLQYPVDKNKPDGPMRKIASYARWETLMEGIQPILSDHGFALSFKNVQRTGDGGGLGICAVLRHIDGHTETGEPFYVPLDTSGGKNNAQAYRSSASYGQRGAATLALNIVTEEDDDDAKHLTGEINRVSEEQVEQLLAKLEEAKIPLGQFLGAHTDVMEIEMVPAESFVRLMNRIDTIMRQKSAKKD